MTSRHPSIRSMVAAATAALSIVAGIAAVGTLRVQSGTPARPTLQASVVSAGVVYFGERLKEKVTPPPPPPPPG